jgi:hypothetical protein
MGDYVPASMRTDLHNPSVKVENAYVLHKRSFSFLHWYTDWIECAVRTVQGEYSKEQGQ